MQIAYVMLLQKIITFFAIYNSLQIVTKKMVKNNLLFVLLVLNVKRKDNFRITFCLYLICNRDIKG